MNRPLPLSLAVALALGSSAAHALGLGGVVVKSELNQPLRAEIPVIANAPDETKGLTVRLASAEDFARVGLSIGSMSVPLSFDIGKNARGDTIILVSSDQPVREPFVSFLIEVDWANGRLLREYSVLLDPPVSAPAVLGSRAAVERLQEPEPLISEPLRPAGEAEAAPEAAAIPAPPEPAAPSVPTAAAPEAEPAVAEAQPEAPPVPEPVQAQAPVAVAPEPEALATPPASQPPGEYGPVASGETLWEVASITRPNEAVSMNQMLLAILRANPGAFFQDNVNALKRGAVLRIPTPEEIAAIEAAEAAVEVVSQNRTWIESTQPTLLADAGVLSSLPPLPASGRNSAGSRLELVPPAATGGEGSGRPGQAGGAGTAALTAEIARAKESLASSQTEVGELRSRVKELEGINQKSERLIELKNSEMKGLQDRLAAAEQRSSQAEAALRAARADAARAEDETAAAIAAAAAAAVTTTPNETVVATPDQAGAELPVDPAVTEAESNVAATEPSADTPAAPSPVEVKPLPEPVAAAAAPVDEAGLTATDEQPWYRKPVFLGAGALLVAILAALGLASRRRKPAALPQRSSVAGAFAGGVGSSVAESTDADSVETDLLNALALDPTDLNTHLNVLEYFYTRGDADKFEAAAEAMYGQIGDENSPEWQAALLMGMELCPSHPLFNREAEPVSHSREFEQNAAATDFAAGDFAEHGESWQEQTESHQPIPKASDFADEFVDSSPQAASADQADGFDFDLMEAELSSQPQVSQPAADDGLSFDFELEKPVSASAPKAAPAAAAMPAPDAVPGGDDIMGEDAVATKIDLARAYLDMGDSDGARSMLEEVLTEGNASQRAEAKELLAEIR
ncbi:MAG: FimV/HubP family polar landmark protein [Lysobacterales bacterium]